MLKEMKTIALSVSLVLVSVTTSANAQVYHFGTNYNLEKATKAMYGGELREASVYFKRASRNSLEESRLIYALTNLCAIDYILGDLDSAARACTKVIREDRKNWQAYYNRGHVRKAQGDLEAAELDYKKATSLNPEDGRLRKALAEIQSVNTKKYAENN